MSNRKSVTCTRFCKKMLLMQIMKPWTMDHGPWNSSKVSVKSRLVRLSQISRKVSESDKNQRSKMWKGFVDIPNEPVCQRWCIFSFKLRWCNKCLYCINNPRYLVEGNKVNLFYRWQHPWAVWSESYVLIGCPSEQNGPFLPKGYSAQEK